MAEAKNAVRHITKASCVVVLLFFATVAIAQNFQGTALRANAAQVPAVTAGPALSRKVSAAPSGISYVDGQLRIDALNATLSEVLTKVAALTGVKIDVPPGANSERMPVVELGPGPARQVLASLLMDSNFDYLIQASDTDPEKIQSVLVMTREKKGSGPGTDAPARGVRSPFARAAAPPVRVEEAPAPPPETPAPPPQDNAAADPNSSNPQPPPAQPDMPTPSMLGQPQPSNLRPGAMSPPQSLTPQSINQQLQQMYQQRMQINQQDRQAAPPPPASRLGL